MMHPPLHFLLLRASLQLHLQLLTGALKTEEKETQNINNMSLSVDARIYMYMYLLICSDFCSDSSLDSLSSAFSLGRLDNNYIVYAIVSLCSSLIPRLISNFSMLHTETLKTRKGHGG